MVNDIFENDSLVVGMGSSVQIDVCNTKHRVLTLHGVVGTQFHANWIILNGVNYSSNKALIIGVADDMPYFGILLEIYIDKYHNVNFVVQETTTTGFDSHFHSHQIMFLPDCKMCQLNQLAGSSYNTLSQITCRFSWFFSYNALCYLVFHSIDLIGDCLS
jgi:hypothetical protein